MISDSDKKINLLKMQLHKLNEPNVDIEGWKSSTKILLERIFGENYIGIKEIEKIKYTVFDYSAFGHYSTNIEDCIGRGKNILETCISEIEIFGIPEKKQGNNSGISISLSQQQNQTTNINLLVSALKENLIGSQYQEIEELMQSHDSAPEKKTKIFEKLKSFGENVLSNILANILTNPSIWG